MLQAMIKQRGESIALYEQGNRGDLAQQERKESFLPRQLDEADIEAAVVVVIRQTGGSRHERHGSGHRDASRAPRGCHRL